MRPVWRQRGLRRAGQRRRRSHVRRVLTRSRRGFSSSTNDEGPLAPVSPMNETRLVTTRSAESRPATAEESRVRWVLTRSRRGFSSTNQDEGPLAPVGLMNETRLTTKRSSESRPATAEEHRVRRVLRVLTRSRRGF